MWLFAVVLLLIIILLYHWYNSRTTAMMVNGRRVDVVTKYRDRKKAAEIMYEVEMRIDKLINHLVRKYPHANHDYRQNTECEICHVPVNKDNVDDLVEQLRQRYSETNVFEIASGDGSVTSYTLNKKLLYFCIRDIGPTSNFVDIERLMFVVIHELTHMMNTTSGHDIEFWINFKFLLKEAVDAGLYTPRNYALYPWNYCGLKVTNNPLYDVLPGENSLTRWNLEDAI